MWSCCWHTKEGKVRGITIDLDDEWMKISVTNRKGEDETKIVRIDRRSEVEVRKGN